MSRFAPHAAARTLVQFAEPVSPHVAATQSDGALPDAARDEHLAVSYTHLTLPTKA